MAAPSEAKYARRAVREARHNKTRVLFITSPLSIGADTWVQLQVLRHLPQAHFALFAAAQPVIDGDEPAQAFESLREIPGIALRPTNFGPSLSWLSRLQQLQRARGFVPAMTSLLGLVRYIRHHRIELLHATDRPRDAIACAALSALTGAKAVIHVHVKYGAWMSKGVKWALSRADALVGVSRFVADSLIAGGYRAERVHTVLNAIEPANWDPSLSAAQGRAALGVSPRTPLIVSVSRLFPSKGHRELLHALALVKRELADVKLAIVGADYPAGAGTTRDLRALALELGIADNVIFTGARADVPALLAASDVFALASFEEPFGLVYAEAMAMKRPVVGLSNGGTPEVVDHGRNGFLSAPNDIEALAANLLTLLRDPSLRQRFGEDGRRQVESRFAPERMANDFAALYKQLLA